MTSRTTSWSSKIMEFMSHWSGNHVEASLIMKPRSFGLHLTANKIWHNNMVLQAILPVPIFKQIIWPTSLMKIRTSVNPCHPQITRIILHIWPRIYIKQNNRPYNNKILWRRMISKIQPSSKKLILYWHRKWMNLLPVTGTSALTKIQKMTNKWKKLNKRMTSSWPVYKRVFHKPQVASNSDRRALSHLLLNRLGMTLPNAALRNLATRAMKARPRKMRKIRMMTRSAADR